MTGFRVGCAQGLGDITPDLSTFGKIVGGGMPLGAFGGKREIMEQIARSAWYIRRERFRQPCGCRAGLATLKLIQGKRFYESLTAKTKMLCDGPTAAAKNSGVTFSAQNIGGMFGLILRKNVRNTYDEVLPATKKLSIVSSTPCSMPATILHHRPLRQDLFLRHTAKPPT